MAYNQPSKTPVWQANNTGTVNKYGAPPNNANRQAITQANTFSTQDYTGRGSVTLGENATNTKDANAVNDQASPLTLSASAGNATLIVIPPNAISITLVSSAPFNFSETGTAGAALTQYATWPANAPVSLDTARISQLLVSGSAVSQVLSFYFQII